MNPTAYFGQVKIEKLDAEGIDMNSIFEIKTERIEIVKEASKKRKKLKDLVSSIDVSTHHFNTHGSKSTYAMKNNPRKAMIGFQNFHKPGRKLSKKKYVKQNTLTKHSSDKSLRPKYGDEMKRSYYGLQPKKPMTKRTVKRSNMPSHKRLKKSPSQIKVKKVVSPRNKLVSSPGKQLHSFSTTAR